MKDASAANNDEPISAALDLLPIGSPVYNRLLQCLYHEAILLDEWRFDDWLALLADDLRYVAPLRVTLNTTAKTSSIVRSTQHFDDNYASIRGRVERLKTKSAWAEDPRSRTRRFITNVLAYETAKTDEYEVVSYILLSRSRYEEDRLSMFSAMRRDIWRQTATGWRLSRREIIVDQSVLGMQNLAVFL